MMANKTPSPPAPLPQGRGESKSLPPWGEGFRERGNDAGGKGSSLLDKAKALRSYQTEAEERLWYYLRAHRFMGLKFKRQKPIPPYIVDFVCLELGLVVEIDGGQHAEQADYDQMRDAFLKGKGFTVLRYWNHEVLGQTEAVLESIRQAVLALNTLSPSPSRERGEKSLPRGMRDLGRETLEGVEDE